jgi:hypothetical protein
MKSTLEHTIPMSIFFLDKNKCAMKNYPLETARRIKASAAPAICPCHQSIESKLR